MDASKSRSKSYDAEISERLGLFVAPSLQEESLAEPDSEKAGVRGLVSRRIEQSLGGLKKRLAVEDEAAVADPGYIVDVFDKRDRRRGAAAAKRG